MPPELLQVTGVGLAGVTIWLFYKLASNHIHHNTTALHELKDVIKELKEFLVNHHP